MKKSIIDVIKEKYIEECECYYSCDDLLNRKRHIHTVCVLEDLLEAAEVTPEEIEELDRQARKNVRGE